MLEQETIEHYRKLLEIYRRNLHHLLEQVALHGGMPGIPLDILNNLQRTRADIRQAKEILRANGVAVADQPGDEEPANQQSISVPLATQAYTRDLRHRLGLRLLAGLLATLILLLFWPSGMYSALFLPSQLASTPAAQDGFSVSSLLSATDVADWTAAPLLPITTTLGYSMNQDVARSPVPLAAPTKTPEPQPPESPAEPQPAGAPIQASPSAGSPSHPPTATQEPPTATRVPVQATPTVSQQSIVACVQIDRLSMQQGQLTNIISGEPRFRVVALLGPVERISEEHKVANTVPKTPDEDMAGQEIEPAWKICEPINGYIEAGNIVRLQIQAAVIMPDHQAHVADISPIAGEALNLRLQLPQSGSECTIWQAKDNPQAISGSCGKQIHAIGNTAGIVSSDILPLVDIWFTVTLHNM
jgi:hypothetical protein